MCRLDIPAFISHSSRRPVLPLPILILHQASTLRRMSHCSLLDILVCKLCSLAWRNYGQLSRLGQFFLFWLFYNILSICIYHWVNKAWSRDSVYFCQGPGPPVSGSSPGGSREFEGGTESVRKNSFIWKYKERLGKNSVVGKLVEKRCWITWFMWKTNKVPRQGTYTVYVRPPAPAWIVEGAPPWAPSHVGLRSQGK